MGLTVDLKTGIKFYDINFWIGENYLSKKFSIPDTRLAKILEKRKDKFNIIGTLITHFISYFYNPRIGNDIVSGLLSNNDIMDFDLDGTMVMEQDYFYEPGSFEKGLLSRYDQGFRILRLFPRSHKYPFEIIGFGKFYEVLNHYSFPVMISLDEIDITGNKNIEWEKILEIAGKYKDIPIIIDGGASKELMYNSFLFSLLNNSQNIYLNTHNLLAMDQIEDLVNIGGPEKLLFDSYFPYYEPHLSIGRLINSSISRENKEKISNLNIQNIFKEIKI
ncbi:MAG: hypothetical protein MUP02_06550 [Actinobacteria bacterium]|nr:hypothetical protein [Actinomycetota bacterium]